LGGLLPKFWLFHPMERSDNDRLNTHVFSHFRCIGVAAHSRCITLNVEGAPEEFDAYATYRGAVIIRLCESLLPIYKSIEETLWSNLIFEYVKRSYHYYDQDLGIFEYYIPTAPNGENFMQYLRVAVKVVPKLSMKRLVDESRGLRSMITSPMGIIDGEMIFIVSPEAVRDEDGNLPRGFYHNIYRHYMTYAIVTSRPERAVERTLTLVWRCLYQRLARLWDKLNLSRWALDRLLRGACKVGRNILSWLLANRFSMTLVTILENFVALCRFLYGKVKEMRRIVKMQLGLKSLRSNLRWLQAHIREGRLLKEIKTFLKTLDEKLMTSNITSNLRTNKAI